MAGGSDAEVEGIIREADRDSVMEVAKRYAINEQTIYAWRKRFGELRTEDVRRLRQLDGENARLKKLVARLRLQAPARANQVWSYDFVFDRWVNGQQLKCLR